MKRRHFTPEEKSKIVLELLREEKTSSEIAQEYQIHPNMLSRWKSEFLANMHTVFAKENSNTEKMKKEYETEKEELIRQIGQLTIEVNWLKKKSGIK